MKPGYKQTEVGVIPEEWEVKNLGDLCTFTQGVQIPQSEQIRHRRDGYIRYLYIRDFFTDDFEWFVRDANPSKIMAELDIMMVNTGSTAGMVYTGAKGVLSNNAFRIRFDRNALTRDFLFAFLTSPRSQETIRNFANSAAQPHVGHKNIAQVPIGFPPLPEQRAIATALSDVDALLCALDRLIAKKRDLKQAAMQQLLTGQTRLPGFVGAGFKPAQDTSAQPLDLFPATMVGLPRAGLKPAPTDVPHGWEVKRLGDILKVRHGKSQHGITAPDGKYPILASGGEIGRTNAYIYDKPSVLIGRKGTIDSPQYVDLPFWTVDTLFFTEISSEADAKFVFYKFTMIRWRSYNEASGVPSLNTKTIENIEVQLPPLPEQTAIAAVLTDMDAELAALTQRLAKTRALKQGMMQELLTGRTRLI